MLIQSNRLSLSTMKLVVITFFLLAIPVALCQNNTTAPTDTQPEEEKDVVTSSTQSSRRPILEYPSDFFSDEVRRNGGFLVHILILVYSCLSLAIVCERFFLKSLERISKALDLSPDIAGSTFMALGLSSPELITSFIGVLNGSDIGTGTIVGAAVFNMMAVPAVCGLAAHFFLIRDPVITEYPIIRNIIFYILSIIILILSIKKNSIDWIESLSLIVVFIIFLFVMFYNAYIVNLFKARKLSLSKKAPKIVVVEDDEQQPLLKKAKNSSIEIDDDEEQQEDYSKINLVRDRNGYHEVRNGTDVTIKKDEDTDWVDSNCFTKWLMMPATIIFNFTIPKPSASFYWFTFLISILWIIVLTYISSWMAIILSSFIGITHAFAGIVILSAVTSIPQMISCFLVVKKHGLADLAISNSIASNIFDILIGLGLPWFLQSMYWVISRNLWLGNWLDSAVPIRSESLPFTAMTLLATAFILLATLHNVRWRLGKMLAIVCIIVYVLFVLAAGVLDVGIN